MVFTSSQVNIVTSKDFALLPGRSNWAKTGSQPGGRGSPTMNKHGHVLSSRWHRSLRLLSNTVLKGSLGSWWALGSALRTCTHQGFTYLLECFQNSHQQFKHLRHSWPGTIWDTHVCDMCSLSLGRQRLLRRFEPTMEKPPKRLCQPL